MSNSIWQGLGALSAATAVAMGAFGAHALKDQLVEGGQLDNWETAVRYQVWHALALILFAVVRQQRGSGSGLAGWMFALGSLFFSGSLYALALGTPASLIWPFTPAGGLLLLIGWILFAISALRAPKQ